MSSKKIIMTRYQSKKRFSEWKLSTSQREIRHFVSANGDTEIQVDPSIKCLEELSYMESCQVQIVKLPDQDEHVGQEMNEEIKLEQMELIVKDELLEEEELGLLQIIQYNTNPPRESIRDRTANTEITVDRSIIRGEELFKICSSDDQVEKLPETVQLNLQDNVGQFEWENCRAQKMPTCVLEDNNAYQMNEEIKLEQMELIVKDELLEVEELGLLQIIQYNTNPPRESIRDRTANTEITVDPSIIRGEELFKICSSDDQVEKLPETVQLNLQDNVGQFEWENCRAQKMPTCVLEDNNAYQMKKKIRLEQDELIRKDEPEELIGSLEIFKYRTNPPTLGIRDCAASTEIKVDPLIIRSAELLKICTCDVRVVRLPEQEFITKKDRNYKCQLCDRKFTLKRSLKLHMLVHENKRPFKCSECGKSFKRSCYLTLHMSVHENKRPFKCSECGKSFKRNCYLTLHMSFHAKKINK